MAGRRTGIFFLLMIAVAAIILYYPFAIFALLMTDQIGTDYPAIAMGILVLLLCILCIHKICFKSKIRPFVISVLIIIALDIGVITGFDYYLHTYLPSITIGQSSIIVDDYIPFSGSPRIVRLSRPSTLILNENQPRLDGVPAALPVYAAIAEAVYAPATVWADDGVIDPVIDCSGTESALSSLIAGKRDIIFIPALTQAEEEAVQALGLTLKLSPLFADALVFLVHKNNPVSALSSDQIRAIYTGRITNWQQLGGEKRDIRAFQRQAGSAVQRDFLAFMGGDRGTLIPPAVNTDPASSQGIAADYRNSPTSIGYTTLRNLNTSTIQTGYALPAVDGAAPDAAHLADGSYPLSYIYYAATVSGRETAETRALLDWLHSDQAEELIRQSGYVPLIQPLPQDPD